MQIEVARFTDDPSLTAAFYERVLDRDADYKNDDMAVFIIDNVKLFIQRKNAQIENVMCAADFVAFSTDAAEIAYRAVADVAV